MRSPASPPARHAGLPGRLAAGIATVALLASGAVAASAPAAVAAYPDTFNPFAIAGGFTVYAREDALLQNQETEGSIAAGGTTTVQGVSGTYSIIHVAAGTADYTLPTVDGDPTRLLTGQYSTESTGILQITSAGTSDPTLQGDLKLVDRDGPFQPFARADFIRLNTNPAQVDQTPLIDATHQQYPADAAPPSGPAGGGSIYTANTGPTAVADYVEANQEANWSDAESCLADLPTTGFDASVNTAASAPPDRVVLNPLSPDRVNVLDYAELPAGTRLLQFSEGPTPGVANPLVIRVPAGTTTVNGLSIDPQGQYSPYVFWDLSALTGPVDVTAPGNGTTRMDGSIYAPNADVTVTASPLDGQIIGQNVTIAGGEVHSYLFAGTIACGGQPQPGTFAVAKALSGISTGDLPPGTVFTVDYTAALPDGTVAGGSVDLPADGTAVPAGLVFPAGTVITFSEIEPATVPGWTWGETTIAPNPITIGAGQTAEVTVTNTATPEQLGTVTLEKRAVDENGAPLPFSFDVPVEWSSSDGRDGTVTLTANGTAVTVGSFPLGTSVNFTEDFTPPAGYDWTDATWSPSSSVVVTDASQTTAVVVTNELTATSGRVIRVVKSVAGSAERAYDYSIGYNRSAPNDDRTDRPIRVGVPTTLSDVDADVETLFLSENVPSLDGVQDASLWQQPTITVTSTAGIQVFTAPYGTEAPIDIRAGGDISIVIENALVPAPEGSFALQKAFAAESDIDADTILPTRQTFGFYVAWTASTGESGTVRLPVDGSPVTPVDAAGDPLTFPYGTVITYQEVRAPQIPGVEWTLPPPAALTIGDGGSATVTGTVTNSATWKQGTFLVAKDFAGIDASLLPPGTTFTIEYSARLPLGTVETGSFQIPADGTPTGPGRTFPVGTFIQATEVAPDPTSLPPGYEWAGTSWSPASYGFIREYADPTFVPTVTVTNTVEQFTRYQVTKTVAGNAESRVPADTTFTARTWLDNVPAADVSLRLGETYLSPWLPVGTVVEAQEADFPDVPGVDWGDPVWMLADGTVLTYEPDGRVVLPASAMGTQNTVELVLENQATTPLPATGGTLSPVIPTAGITAVLLGLALVTRRRARTS